MKKKKILIIIIIILIILLIINYFYKMYEFKMIADIKALNSPSEQASLNSNFYTLNDIQMHATADNCWMAIDNKVYNVTEFVSKHPGGDKILLGCGKDATELFNKIKAHAKAPVQALKNKFIIGFIK